MNHPISHPRRLVHLLTFLALVLSGWAGLALAAQDPPEEITPEEEQEEFDVFVDQVNVNVVNVDVYVTDKKGNRITDLTPDDFELTENGRPVAISNFYKVEGGRRLELAPGPAVAEGAGPAEPRFEAIEPTLEEPPEEQRLHLVVYIDNWNLRPFNRNRVLGDVRRFLIEKLGKDDRVMLVTYDRSFKVEQPFTSDLRAVARATFDIEKRVAGGVNRDSERNQMIQLIDDSQGEFEALSHARSYAQSVENDLTFTLRALKELTESLAGLPGRKAILYVSDGLPQVAGQDLFLAVDEKFGSASNGAMAAFNFDFHREYTRLAAEANANGVTFYPLDARGLEPPSANSAEFRGTDIRGAADRHRIPNLQTPLRYLAEETGGFAIVNTNSPFPFLERMAADFDSFYSLGYTPAHYGDGRYYNLKVKVKPPKGKGLIVRHREGYRDLSTETRMSDGTMAALNYDVTDNPLGVKLEFEDEQKRDDGFYLLPVQVRIPIGNVAMIPRETTHEGRVKVYVGALDDRGRSSPVQQMMVPISIPNDEIDFAKTQEYVYTVTLLMRAGSQRVAVGVRDEISAEETFLNRQVLLGNPRRG
jgi:VWFA-related protein